MFFLDYSHCLHTIIAFSLFASWVLCAFKPLLFITVNPRFLPHFVSSPPLSLSLSLSFFPFLCLRGDMVAAAGSEKCFTSSATRQAHFHLCKSLRTPIHSRKSPLPLSRVFSLGCAALFFGGGFLALPPSAEICFSIPWSRKEWGLDKSQTGRNMTTEFALRAKSLKSCVYPVDVAERTRVRGRGATRFLAGGISGISVYILHYSVLNRISKYFIHFISDSVSNRIVWLYIHVTDHLLEIK